MATETPTSGGGPGTNLGLEPKIAGLLCYVPCCIGLIFSVVAAIVEKQSRFVRFHAFQSLLLHGVFVVLWIAITVVQVALGFMGLGAVSLLIQLLSWVVGLALLALTIFMMIKANAGEEYQLPTIGPMARGWV
jgi:uncharacterized membrane protein